MGLQEIASWYQRKIGTYDKQQWERTIEQRILHGLTHVPRKTAKLKTKLIDVDLVRGSSFSKAKPKHGLLTVARLGTQRLLFLPVYWQWWIQQTSSKVYAILLLLYCLQVINVSLYYHYTQIHLDDTAENVPVSEVLVPTVMMVVLSIIHSQIVCTHNGQSSDSRERTRRCVKRVKRRILSSRLGAPITDCKCLPDTNSEKKIPVGETSGKFNRRLRFRRNLGSDSQRTSAQASPAHGAINAPRIRVCFKEPEEDCIEAVPHEAERVREGTPLDDDGFESLNGNGSSENGDEPVENNLECKNEPQANTKQTSYSDMFLVNSDQSLFEKNVKIEDSEKSQSPEADYKSYQDESNLCKIESFDKFICNKLNYNEEVHDKNLANENLSDDKLCAPIRSDLNLCDVINSELEKNETLLDCKRPTEDEANEVLNRSHLLQRKQTMSLPRLRCHRASGHNDSDSEGPCTKTKPVAVRRRRGSKNLLLQCPTVTAEESSYNSSCGDESEDEVDDEPSLSSPETTGSCCENSHLTEGGTTSATEWMGITTNSEECSYSSDMNESDSQAAPVELNDHPFAWEFEQSPTVILSPSCAASDKVSCTMWESRDVKKADLSVLDISSAIIARVEAMPENMDYFYGGMVMALLLSLVSPLCRLVLTSTVDAPISCSQYVSNNSTFLFLGVEVFTVFDNLCNWTMFTVDGAFGSNSWERWITAIALVERFALAELFFFLLAVAERTFKQRFLYAKLFSHLTSFRRARKSELPHFRLNKVRNIKTWLSVRSYLRKRGPQRSVDMLVSAAFVITLLLLTFLIVELLKDSVRLNSQYNMEALCWCIALGVFLLRFMTLGTDINRKYCNLSVLITEQINLYLQIEQKPNKKEELMVANSVLKLAADLLKELESPFKISGLSANPYLYNITNVVILSALSGVLSEILGFKLKLHKIKIK